MSGCRYRKRKKGKLTPEYQNQSQGQGQQGREQGIDLLVTDTGISGVQPAGLFIPDNLGNPNLWKEFRVPATDTHGHKDRFWGNIPPGMMAQVAGVLESRKFPYRTMADLWRHAIWRHLKWLEMIAGQEFASITRQVDIMNDIMREEEFQLDFQSTFEKTQGVYNRMVSMGDTEEGNRMLWNLKDSIDGMPQGYWRDRWQREFMSRYGHVVENKPRTVEAEGRHVY